jgi:hypothetical protein
MSLKELSNLGITVVAQTGGQCGGKTESRNYTRYCLEQLGYKVLFVPEVASLFKDNGIKPGIGELSSEEFQLELIQHILYQEETWISCAERYAKQGRKVVVICDRGTPDGAAYLEEGVLGLIKMINKLGLNPGEVLTHRYHGVIHLRTAALGAEKHYNPRREPSGDYVPVEIARAYDEKFLKMWQDCGYDVCVVDNSTCFEGKMKRVFGEVCRIMNIPKDLQDKVNHRPKDT